MSVRAKFKVRSVTEHEWAPGGKSVELYPVTNGSEENKEFYKATPGGEIKLSTVNPAAAEQFKVGREFYVDFTPADS